MNISRITGIKTAFLAGLTTLFFACEQAPHFTIEGEIKGGEGKTLYLSNIGINKVVKKDSITIGKNEKFSFHCACPECYDFYTLQLHDNNKRIIIAIDSTESVKITTSAKHFTDSCKIEGSPESVRIQELAALEQSLQKQINAMIRNGAPAIGETREAIYSLIGDFKQNIFKQYIAAAPHKASAYYALFMRLNGEPLFQPTVNRFDSHCFAAVATSLHGNYPHATRAIHLYNIATKGMAATRSTVPADTIDLESESIEKIGLYEIKLPNIHGDSISLRALKGKVVLLDFTIYSNAGISSRNIKLREIYDKYQKRGFEIYQVSFDANESFWNNSADKLPWICVRDGDGEASKNILLYNLHSVPTYYLINRNNELVLRDNQVEDLETAIEELLKN